VEEALRADLREVLGGHVDLSRVAACLVKVTIPAWYAMWSAASSAADRTLNRWPISTLGSPIATQSVRKRRQRVPWRGLGWIGMPR